MDELIFKKLESIEQMLEEQNLLRKEVLNVREAARYLEISESHLYKLTCTNVLPCYKPNGKKLYFNRQELESWLMSNRQNSVEEVESRVNNLKLKSGR